MENILIDLPLSHWILACLAALFAGFVKGVVGFAMPLIMISLLSTFLSPDLALAGLMLPTVFSNLMQAVRDGVGPALASIKQYKVLLITAGIVLVATAQLYAVLPLGMLLMAIGIPVVLFSALQIAGWRTTIPQQTKPIEMGFGVVAGFFGGLAAIWGPTIVIYLTALNTEKRLQMRTQGAAFGLGSLLLLFAHGPSGVVRLETLTFSALLCIPAIIGMKLGMTLQDRINQETFRRATLWILLLAGINLLRRAWIAM